VSITEGGNRRGGRRVQEIIPFERTDSTEEGISKSIDDGGEKRGRVPAPFLKTRSSMKRGVSESRNLIQGRNECLKKRGEDPLAS